MAKRRGKNEGSISKRADGRWMGRVSIDRGDNGRRRRRTVYGVSRADVSRKIASLLGRNAGGELLGTSTPTLARWLELWYDTHQDRWRPGTKRVYRSAIDGWIVPALGQVRLDALKPVAVQQWVNAGAKDGGRRMLTTAHVVLRSALRWAMRQRVLTFNAADLVTVPRPPTKPGQPLTADQAVKLLEAAGEHRLGALVVVAMTTGLRVGEAVALRWADVDLAGQTLKVRRQLDVAQGKVTDTPLKTAASRRTLTLPAEAVTALKGLKVRQLEERLQAGASWAPDGDYCFTMPGGSVVRAEHARTVLAELLKSAGLPTVRFHSLRHTAATLLLAAGVPLFDVSRVLGHSTISTTADIYGHLVDDMTAGAATQMDAVLARARRGVR